MKAIEDEVKKEDPALWPGLAVLLDELLLLLRALPRRHRALMDDKTVSAAVAMALRVKIICVEPGASASAEKKMAAMAAPPTRRSSVAVSANAGAGIDPAAVSKMEALAARVRTLESDLRDDNLPERHLFMLRDLRVRVTEAQRFMGEDLEQKQQVWTDERVQLTAQIDGAQRELEVSLCYIYYARD